ncbi:hypothetical protein EYF80_044106 [Liparis tanakae]|uniref:Uncharacterized protein n=1 Tax=Liparis tanakae TaxID=230148 RepID=A0A4Z2FXV4_9TELE|nr:hypothetical protein EYF80_044106 [Liparis tanakae]
MNFLRQLRIFLPREIWIRPQKPQEETLRVNEGCGFTPLVPTSPLIQESHTSGVRERVSGRSAAWGSLIWMGGKEEEEEYIIIIPLAVARVMMSGVSLLMCDAIRSLVYYDERLSRKWKKYK